MKTELLRRTPEQTAGAPTTSPASWQDRELAGLFPGSLQPHGPGGRRGAGNLWGRGKIPEILLPKSRSEPGRGDGGGKSQSAATAPLQPHSSPRALFPPGVVLEVAPAAKITPTSGFGWVFIWGVARDPE